jgi:creatinine amidohydrolase
MSTIRPFILKETNWKNSKDEIWEVAVLPWGATEAHNYHLPYSTDCIEAEYIAENAAEIAWNNGAKIMVLPTIPFGVNNAQKDVKFNINMNSSTQFLVLKDIVDSLKIQGCKKLLIVNGHGGNSFSHMIRELYQKEEFLICTLDWYKVVNAKEYFEQPGDHADEMETSVMMHIAPELVLPLSEAGKGEVKKINIKSLNEGWAWTQRGWLGDVTNDNGIGNPALATPEKGKKFTDAIINKVAHLLVELDKATLNELYK